ncbi:LuxR C-terminal-related transcriptional regulator [Mycobacterium sp. C31M]
MTAPAPLAADLDAIAAELERMGVEHRRASVFSGDRISDALSGLLEALARVRSANTPEEVLDIAPWELCAVGLFDRVLMSTVRGSTWCPEQLLRADGGRPATVSRQRLGELRIPLASPLVEAEVVRRRLPALVQDAQNEPRTYRPLIESTGSREYVVAPVLASASVVGLLHADVMAGDRALSALDRDLLRVFAEGVGLAYERAGLLQRLEEQRRQVAQACAAAVDLAEAVPATTGLESRMAVSAVGGFRDAVPAPRDRGGEPRESSRLSRLTGREREVLALLASGATNAQLADQLTVAESTVKSHVKHILHKLGAGNRAAAIACYLRENRSEERRPR